MAGPEEVGKLFLVLREFFPWEFRKRAWIANNELNTEGSTKGEGERMQENDFGENVVSDYDTLFK